MPKHIIEPGSFRDRNNVVFYGPGSVYRGLSEQASSNWNTLISKPFYKRFMESGRLVPTQVIDPSNEGFPSSIKESWHSFLKHKPIPYISYPYEWSFGMLKDAALLQLDLLLASVEDDMILKDSSPYNVQWEGARPIFIDIPSFERLNPGDPWSGYGQFCQLYLYPLFLVAYKNVSHSPWLRGNLDGIEAEHMSNLMSLRDLFRPGVFLHVYLHSRAQAKYSDTTRNIKEEFRKGGFNKVLIQSNVKRLRKLVDNLIWKLSKSEWSHYSEFQNYSDPDLETKKQFVRKASGKQKWNLAWDLGCNTGEFSKIVSENCNYVVAMDADHLAIDTLYQSLKKEGNKSILPLINNIADPSPSLGWMNLERKNFPNRGTPDLILCLALIHHIVITANVPLKNFIEWLASLSGALVIEFITKDDPMVKVLLKNKEDIYLDYELNWFEQCLKGCFQIEKIEPLKSGTRILYFATRKPL